MNDMNTKAHLDSVAPAESEAFVNATTEKMKKTLLSRELADTDDLAARLIYMAITALRVKSDMVGEFADTVALALCASRVLQDHVTGKHVVNVQRERIEDNVESVGEGTGH